MGLLAWADSSSSTEEPAILHCGAGPIPRVQVARIRGTPVLTDRSRNYPPKQSLPYIRTMQHTVLFVLGLKGTISEFELNLFRQRSMEAIRQKATRGELQIQIPVGFCWAPGRKLEKDPDHRVQQAIELVFFANSLSWAACAKFYYGFGKKTFACQHFRMRRASARWFGNCPHTPHCTRSSPSQSTQVSTPTAKPRHGPRL